MTQALPRNFAPNAKGLRRWSGERGVYLIAFLLFLASSGATLYLCLSMSGGMKMPGGWVMSMAWMRMRGQTWAGSAAMFLIMWLAMMVAMMLPSTLPATLIYRRASAFRGERHPALRAALMTSGYFAVWLAFGAIAYVLGIALAQATMRWDALSRLIPAASGAALIASGVFQFTRYKATCLRHCRDPLSIIAGHLDGGWLGAWKLGTHHGLYCAACCWGLMLIQLVLGVMSIPIMILVAGIIALEKLTAAPQRIVQIVGALAIAGGSILSIRAILSL